MCKCNTMILNMNIIFLHSFFQCESIEYMTLHEKKVNHFVFLSFYHLNHKHLFTPNYNQNVYEVNVLLTSLIPTLPFLDAELFFVIFIYYYLYSERERERDF